jgi:histone acetyltransferase 1
VCSLIGADGIDVTDPRWVVYLTYERLGEVGGENGSLFCPVGYITLFKFFNPLGRKVSSTTTTATNPERIETHRICQVLIFPTHQRQGHGEMLVQCISARAVANDNVYELTVEDPVPAFSQVCVGVGSCRG